MHISELKLWNFRKYGKSEWNLEQPHLIVPFNEGLNVLIGENDSGKTAILDAIKLVLKTHAYEWIRVTEEDFFENASKLRIELLLKGLKTEEAKNFTEWLGWEGESDDAKPILRLIYEVERKRDRIQPAEVKAGMDEVGFPLNAEAREYLKSTYLKALRDADNELVAKKNSRIAQILQGHDLFKEKAGQKHEFVGWFSEVNEKIKSWFEAHADVEGERGNKEQIKDIVDGFLQKFIEETVNSSLQLTDPEIKAILEKISLGISESKNLGLGTMNRLYMAAELLHLKKEWNGLKICLIEELEAHLHPQAQMKVVEALLNEKEVQFILTTHSPNLASKVDIERLIICKGSNVYPLRKEDSKLDPKNYSYLKRFLDVTKSNLFFAKGVIIVEGWAEEILIPALAEKIGYDLTKNEVSIVNVGSTAYLHFAKIYLRKDGMKMGIPVSVVTDLDVRPDESGNFESTKEEEKRTSIKNNFQDLNDTEIKLEIAAQWTLEWCLFKSTLSETFKEAVAGVHSHTDDFKKDKQNQFKSEFQAELIRKLRKDKGTSTLDKVRVANCLAENIVKNKTSIDENDDHIKYLVNAIKHACRKE